MPAFTLPLTDEDREIWRSLRLTTSWFMGCAFSEYRDVRQGHVIYCDTGNMGKWDFRDACLMLNLTRKHEGKR